MNFMNGRPNGFWYNVRKYFVQGARYNINLRNGWTHQIIVPSSARVITYITSIVGTWYGEQKINQNSYVSGNSRVYDFGCQNADISMILVVER